MNRFLAACCAFTLVATSCLNAAELSAEELNRATEHLKNTRAAFIAATDGLSAEQWNFKPAPDRWSVAQVAEHIAAAEDALFGLVQAQVMTAPARTEPVNVKEIDDLILQAIPDRSAKRQAPEPLKPTARFGSGPESVSHFKEARAKTLAFLTETKDLRDHAIDSPLGQKLDAYQWLLFISAHSERHTKQINEVKADPNFPKSLRNTAR
jgi:Protein of unknown function (DUF664).